MSWDTARKGIDWLFSNAKQEPGSSVEIDFWGGEPLLRWKLLELMGIYALAKSKTDKIPVRFGGTTNVTLLTPEKFNFLDTLKCRFLLSIDGAAETHNLHRKFRGTGLGSHATISKNVEAILHRWPDTRVRMGLIAERIDYFFEDIKHLFDMGFNYLYFSPVYEGNWTEEKWRIFEEQSIKVIDYMVELRESGRSVKVEHFASYSRGDTFRHPCGAGRSYVGIDVDGAIYPCHRFNKFNDKRPWQEKEVCIGHVYAGITRPDFVKQFTEWNPNCGSCQRQKDTPCHGGCYAARYDLMNQSLDNPFPGLCAYTEVQKRVSAYYKERIPEEAKAIPGRVNSCVCFNMCYAEGTDHQLITAYRGSDMTCKCYNLSYSGRESDTARALTQEERIK